MLPLDDFGIDTQGFDFLNVELVYFLTDSLYKGFIAFKLDIFYLHFVHFINDALVMGRQHL